MIETLQQSPSRHYLFRNASITATLSAAGVFSGLLLDATILSLFGLGYQTDAFFTALTIPMLVINVLSIQCPKVLIPAFTEQFLRDEWSSAWQLLNKLICAGGVIFAVISLLGVAVSGLIVPSQIPGLETRTIVLATSLSQVLFSLVLLQGLGAIFQSVLYARHRYLVSASGKLISNVPALLLLIFVHDRFGIHAVALGLLAGGIAQIVILFIALHRDGFRYRWVNPADPQIRALIRSFRDPFLGHVLAESRTIIQNIVGSFLGSGSVSVLRYASRIVQAIAGILLGSVVQVTFPLIAKHAAANDLKAQRKTLLESIELLGLIGVPISIWLVLASRPLVVLLFQRGEFSSSDAAVTGLIIGLMVPDILLGRLVAVTQTLFYAHMDMRTPLISTLIGVLAHAVFALSLVVALGVVGLPLAISLASISNTAYMILKVQERFGPVGWSELRMFAVRLAATCLVGVAGFLIGTRLSAAANMSALLAKVLAVAMPAAFGTCAFILAACLFRLIDARLFFPAKQSL